MSTFKNFVQCRVTTPITAVADSIGLYAAVPPYSLPTEEGGLLVLTDSPNNPSKLEVISYTSRSALGLYGVTRGLEGTTALAWTGPVYCYQSLLAGEFKTLLDSKVDKAAGKQLSDENYTSPEKAKLAGIQAGAQVNAVSSVSGRTGAVTLAKGDVGLSNVDNTSDINKPVSTATSTALSGKVDKVTGKGLSENDYTIAEKTKLAGVASEATKNRADSENADKVHTHPWTEVTGQPVTATRWPTFAEVTGKPATYAPDAHTHPVSQVTGLGTAATRNVGTATGNVMEVGAFGAGHTFPATVIDANAIADQVGNRSGFYPYLLDSGSANTLYFYIYIQQLFFTGGNVTQIAYGYNIEATWVRYRFSNVWSPWVKHLTTSDLPITATRWPTAAEAGAAPTSHTHDYLPLTGGTLTGSLSVTGDITATGNVTAYSDIKLKENIELIPDALDKINTLHGYTYNRKDIKDSARHTGVIAQEVQKVLPEAVVEDEGGTLSVAYGNMVGLLIEAIKELKAEVDELKGVK